MTEDTGCPPLVSYAVHVDRHTSRDSSPSLRDRDLAYRVQGLGVQLCNKKFLVSMRKSDQLSTLTGGKPWAIITRKGQKARKLYTRKFP